MYRFLVASLLTLAFLAGSPLLATEPAETSEPTEVTPEKTCIASTPTEDAVSHDWVRPFSQSVMSSEMEPQMSVIPRTASQEACHVLGQVRYIQTSYCCSNGKLREIKETCGPKYGTWGTWVWKYSGFYCIGLFCDGGGDPV